MSQPAGCFVEEVTEDFSSCHHGQQSFAFKDFQVSMGDSKCDTGCARPDGQSGCCIACWDTSATVAYNGNQKDIDERMRCYANMLSPHCSCDGPGFGSGGDVKNVSTANCTPCGNGLTRIECPIHDDIVKPCCSGGSIVFDFFCNVELKEITLLNIDRDWPEPSKIKLYDCHGSMVKEVAVANTGQNGLQVIALEKCNVQRMCVPLDGPGVICSLKYCVLRQYTCDTFTWRLPGDLCRPAPPSDTDEPQEPQPFVPLQLVDGLRLMHSRGFIKHVLISLGKSGGPTSGGSATKVQLKRHRRWPALDACPCPLYKCKQFSFDEPMDLFEEDQELVPDCGKPVGLLACDLKHATVDAGDALSVSVTDLALCGECPEGFKLADLTVQAVVCFPCNGNYERYAEADIPTGCMPQLSQCADPCICIAPIARGDENSKFLITLITDDLGNVGTVQYFYSENPDVVTETVLSLDDFFEAAPASYLSLPLLGEKFTIEGNQITTTILESGNGQSATITAVNGQQCTTTITVDVNVSRGGGGPQQF